MLQDMSGNGRTGDQQDAEVVLLAGDHGIRVHGTQAGIDVIRIVLACPPAFEQAAGTQRVLQLRGEFVRAVGIETESRIAAACAGGIGKTDVVADRHGAPGSSQGHSVALPR